MRVALFVSCIVDTLFPDVGRATVAVLERLGHEVVFPSGQTCCGQMHANSGYSDDASKLAARFVRIFSEYEAVVTPSSSCAGHVRHACPSLASRVFELSEFLVHRLDVTDVGARFPHRVAYHPTCHSQRVARVGAAPTMLLQAVRGIELAGVSHAEECCGFGGTFALKNAATSAAMLADKCAALEASGAEVCTAVDASCLLHIGGGLARRGSPVRVMHLANVLAAT